MWQTPKGTKRAARGAHQPLFITYHQSWINKVVSVGGRLANLTPSYKKGWKVNLGNYRPLILTSVPGKVTEQIILSAVTQYV